MSSIKNWLFKTQDSKREKFWEGRALHSNVSAALVYLVVLLAPLVAFAWSGKPDVSCLSERARILFLSSGLFVSIAPPAWFWLEARAFDDWVRKRVDIHSLGDNQEKRLRETFKLNADGERAFWAAIVAVYAAVFLKF